MSSRRERIDVSGGDDLRQNPFADLAGSAFPAGSGSGAAAGSPTASRPDDVRAAGGSGGASPSGRSGRREPNRNRGRVDVVRQTAGRGGKTVTVISGFKGIAAAELHEIAREIRRLAGVGGTIKGGSIEIQGDQRERACAVLEEAGFRPVRAGG